MSKKESTQHKKNSSISGKSKFVIILPFLGLILIAVCICTFFYIQNLQHRKYKAKETSMNELYYAKVDKKILEKPTLPPQTVPSNLKVKIPIIMYHYIEYVKDPNDTMRKSLAITPSTFEFQLNTLLKNDYTMYYVKDIPHILNGDIKMASKSAVLTFDDGYEDFYTDALPILKKHNTKATLYVISNFIGRKGYLTEAELKDIVASGVVEIGGHTLDHPYMKGMKESLAREEIFQNKADLEKMLGIKLETFAYPYGAFDDTTIQLVKEASYSAAVSVIPGNVHSNDTLFYLYRIRAGSFLGRFMLYNLEKNFDDPAAAVKGIFKIFKK